MNYQELKPLHTLQKYIDAYWFLDEVRHTEKYSVLPDESMDVIFNLGEKTSVIPAKTAVVSGMMTTFREVSVNVNTTLVGVRFRTGQLSGLIQSPLSETKNKTIPVGELIPYSMTELFDKLANESGIANRKLRMDTFFDDFFRKKEVISDRLIDETCFVINNFFKEFNIRTFSKSHAISVRQLERRFKKRVGVTLKEYYKIVRFQSTIQYIAKHPGKSLWEIAFDRGYFDHAHMSNDVKQCAGKPPSDFR